MSAAAMKCNTRDTWATPEDLREAVVRVFGCPTLDVAASQQNKFVAHKDFDPIYDGREADGLHLTWAAHTYAWCNPPGSQVAQWIVKAKGEQEAGARSLLLVQCGMSSKWYESVRWQVQTILLSPRPQFIPPEGIPKSSNPRDYMLLLFEPWMVHLPSERITRWNWKGVA